MKIAGVQKTSLIDYPEQIASVIFTQGCNFACPYCHNANLIPSSSPDNSYYSIDNILNFLDSQQELIDGIVITGGEPTLQQELVEFIKQVKSKNLKVKLDTNGSRPKVIAELIEQQLLDYIAMDVKTPFNNQKQVIGTTDWEEEIKASIQLLKNSELKYEFRTTVVPSLHDTAAVKKIGQLIKGADLHYIQNFRPKNTLEAKFLDKQQFPPAKLEEFKAIMLNYVSEVLIRN